MTAPIDYDAVLADLIARRDKLNAAINVIRGVMGSPATGEGDDPAERDDDGGDAGPVAAPRPPRQTSVGSVIQNDTFFGLSTPEAIRKFLMMTKRPQRVADISKAMLEGGQIHARDTTTAYNNVYAALKRMRKSGEAVRIKTGEWGLGSWYGPVKPPVRSRPNGGESSETGDQ
jgi:hypothetical protein